MSILIDNGRITTLPAAGQGPGDAQVIDCGGHVVIPDLIDTHWQAPLAPVSQIVALTQDIGFLHLMAGQEAGETLMRGFTTLRDVGGPAFGRKAATDRGVVTGPRIFPAGAIISQTSGHGDFRFQNSLPMMPGDPADYASRQGMAFLADEDANQYTDIKAVAAQRAVAEGTARASEWADKHRVNRAFGTDILYGRRRKSGAATGEAGALHVAAFGAAPGDGRRGCCWRCRAGGRPIAAGWRAIDTGSLTMDGLGGVQVWEDQSRGVGCGRGAAAGRGQGLRRSDRCLAGQLHACPRWSAISYIDHGTTGMGSDSTTQVFATVNYQMTGQTYVSVGYRRLDVDYRSGITRVDATMAGPLLGLTGGSSRTVRDRWASGRRIVRRAMAHNKGCPAEQL